MSPLSSHHHRRTYAEQDMGRIPERLRNVDLTVYEKNEGIGGVWFLNKYPGLACDIPCKYLFVYAGFTTIRTNPATNTRCAAHSYQYSFAPNPHWSKMYAPGAEIQRYLQNTAERFGATRFIKTQHRVDRCEYLADEKKWYGVPCYDTYMGTWTNLV